METNQEEILWSRYDRSLLIEAEKFADHRDLESPDPDGPRRIYVCHRGRVYVRLCSEQPPFRSRMYDRVLKKFNMDVLNNG